MLTINTHKLWLTNFTKNLQVKSSKNIPRSGSSTCRRILPIFLSFREKRNDMTHNLFNLCLSQFQRGNFSKKKKHRKKVINIPRRDVWVPCNGFQNTLFDLYFKHQTKKPKPKLQKRSKHPLKGQNQYPTKTHQPRSKALQAVQQGLRADAFLPVPRQQLLHRLRQRLAPEAGQRRVAAAQHLGDDVLSQADATGGKKFTKKRWQERMEWPKKPWESR